MKKDEMLDGWFTAPKTRFGTATAAVERFQGAGPDAHFSTAETYWFCIPIPEQGLAAHFYLVLRPRLQVAHAGSWIYQGVVDHPLLARHFNFQTALPYPTVENNTIHVPAVGLTIDVMEPMKRLAVRYRPPSEPSTSADLVLEAVTPVIMTGDERHLDQAIRCSGTLTLDGQEHVINSLGFRDRSWGSPRPEAMQAHPPLAYVWGLFDNGRIALNLRAADDPERAEWLGTYELSKDAAFHDGWIVTNGELRKVVQLSKWTERDAEYFMRPLAVHAEFTDSAGERYRLSGRARSGLWFAPWQNVLAWFEFMEWDLNGITGHGEIQDFTWSHNAKRFWRSKTSHQLE